MKFAILLAIAIVILSSLPFLSQSSRPKEEHPSSASRAAVSSVMLAGNAASPAENAVSAADRNAHLDSGSQLVPAATTAASR